LVWIGVEAKGVLNCVACCFQDVLKSKMWIKEMSAGCRLCEGNVNDGRV